MTTRYKLTDKDGYTRRGKTGETHWVPGTVRETSGDGELCSRAWTHVYTDPLLAVLLDPIHSEYGPEAKMIRVAVAGKCKTDRGLNEGWTVVRYEDKHEKPVVTTTQRIAFGILCAKAAQRNHRNLNWNKWADDWLTGIDRSADAARVVFTPYTSSAYATAAAYAVYAVYATDAFNATFAARAAAFAVSAGRKVDLTALAHAAIAKA